MDLNLRARRALVTGANSGIGRAIALALAREGARVCVNYVVDPDAAQAAVGEITGSGGAAFAAQADVSDPAQVGRMFADIDRTWGGLDILINNAGIDGGRAPGWEQGVDAWRRVLDINLTGAYLCAREALRRMVPARRGVVLNLTSVHERIPWTGYSAYTASKAGLSMLTKTLAQEAAPSGVRVVALAPGAIQTPINQDVWGDPAQLQDLLTKIPLGRLGTVDDVARMVAVLVSDVAGYITGTTLFVDGGMTLYPSFMRGG
ncbi:MAG TPA: 3-oxoacyl-ACP reductase FabG [bacterium]|nr:3-oxoacyl-ACP reductase FabG [bacterium]